MATTKKKTPRKRRRKKRYKTGIHLSPKCSEPIHYRSGWELVACIYLDNNPKVASYTYEGFAIPYVSNARTKKVRHYFPDFLVEYQNGSKLLVEVKREDQLSNQLVLKKAAAANTWAKNNNATYTFWTNKFILPLMSAFKKKQMI